MGQPYSATLQATGGVQPYTWSIVPGQGDLPPGLSLDSHTGLISGTPTAAGTFGFVVQVQDSSGLSNQSPIRIQPNPPNGGGGQSYPPTPIQPAPNCSNFAIVDGKLPDGMNLDQNTGVVSGVPLDGGIYTFVVGCVTTGSGGGQTVTQSFTITITNPLPAITSLSPSSVIAGGPDLTMDVFGSNFVESSVVDWNGTPLSPPQFIDSTHVKVLVPAADIASPGTAHVTVVNPDPNGGTSNSADFTIKSPNIPPTVSLSGPATVNEGSSATFTFTVTDPDTGDSFTVKSGYPDCGGAGPPAPMPLQTTASGGSFQCFFPDGPASSTISIVVTDSHGADSNTATTNIAVQNVAPTPAIAGAPSTSPEGTAIALTASATDPSQPDTQAGFSFAWSVTKNGQPFGTPASGVSFSFTPDDNGSYVVSLTATDKDHGTSQPVTATISVTDVPPTATFTAPTTPVSEGQSFSISLTDPQDVSTADVAAGFTYAFDCGDGHGYGAAGTASSATCSDGGYPGVTVKGKILDKDGQSTEYTASVTITNLPPTVTPPANQTANEGSSTAFTLGSFGDPGADGPWTVDVDWGDGSAHTTFSAPSRGTLGSQSHTYADNGSYTAAVMVTDQGKASSSAPFKVTVANVAPMPAINGAPSSSPEGTAINLTGSATDPNPVDTAHGFSFAWSVTKNGQPYGSGGSGQSFGFTPDDNGTYVVSLTATDKDGGTGQTTTTITVTNVAPSASNLHVDKSTLNEGDSLTLTGTISDPSTADVAAGFTLSINWGDGTQPQTVKLPANATTFSVPHLYADDNPTGTPSDINTISVSATDKDNGTGAAATTQVTVKNVAPVAGTPSVTPAASGNIYAAGTAVTLTLPFSDVGVQDTHTCAIVWDSDNAASTSAAGSVAESGGSESCTGSHTYVGAGVYNVQIVVKDDDTGQAAATLQIVVYDPSAGFVTGGGWIDSSAGACQLSSVCQGATGRANFGFVAKYQKGATTPTGQTEFQFQAGNLDFHSDSYQWLVVSGAKAQFKGTGSINGVPGYSFLLTATDGELPGGGGVDKFRIKITGPNGGVVYDNVPGGSDDLNSANPEAISGGSIVIHTQ